MVCLVLVGKPKYLRERGNEVSYYKLPRGAKRTSEWAEVSSEAYPTGWAYDEITKVTYDDGIKANAVMVELYHKGKRVYRQAFYGETADSDAWRESSDALNKLAMATPTA
jgi:hypothetical protein